MLGLEAMIIEFIEIHGGEVRIELAEGGVLLFDEADLPKLGHHKWHIVKTRGGRYLSRSRYVCRGKYRRELMHRIIMDAPAGVEVHHINGDTLDNRRSNLQLYTPTEHRALHGRKASKSPQA